MGVREQLVALAKLGRIDASTQDVDRELQEIPKEVNSLRESVSLLEGLLAKERNDLLGDSLLPEWLDIIPPFITERGVLGHNRGRQRNRDQADVNVLVSNLRGPRERWHLGPALVEDLYLSGPPSNGVGSNFLVWSYGDRMLFGIRSFADSLDSPAELRMRLEDALAELVGLARQRTGAAVTPA